MYICPFRLKVSFACQLIFDTGMVNFVDSAQNLANQILIDDKFYKSDLRSEVLTPSVLRVAQNRPLFFIHA